MAVEMAQLMQLQQETGMAVQQVLGKFQAQVRELTDGDAIQGHLAVYMHETSRRAEEFMHRVNDCITVLAAQTQEGKEDLAETAEANGNLEVLGESK